MSLDVRTRTIRGLGAMTILQVIGATVNFLTLIALARLLTPEDFGVAAIAALTTGLVGTFGDFGLGPAVIQRNTDVEKALYTANTLRATISAAMFTASVAVAPLAAYVFSAPQATDPIRVVSILFLLNGAMFIPQTRLSKELKFGVIFKAALLSSFVSAAVSVGLALSGFGYWTIILASLVAAAVNLGALWILAPWRITIQYDRRIARELVSYGKHLFLTTIFTFFVLNIDNAGVAYLLGTAALGYYALAFKWANVPVNFLSRVAAQVMTPTYVLLRESLDRLRKGYLETVKMITIVSLPVYVGLLVMADEFVSLALGPTWLPIVLALRILCVMGILRGLTEPGAYLFMAIGKSRLVAVSTGVHLAILAILLAPGLYYGGIAGAAAAVAVAYGLNAIIVQRFVNREIGTRWSDLWHLVRNLVLGGLAMAASLFTLRILFPASAVLFLASISASLGVYLLLLRTLEGNLFADYLRQILGARRA